MREKDWIKITTPENKDMIASPGYVKKLMGIDLMGIFNRLQRAEYKLDKLESPSRQDTIINLLSEHGRHNKTWIENRVSNYHWYDLAELIKTGIVIETKSGSVSMFELTSPSSRRETK